MIDLHCHILARLDDGARDLADSVAMARQAVDDGIAAVCATPHIRSDHDVVPEQVLARVQELQRELDREQVDLQILPAGELAQEEAARLSDEQLTAITYGATGRWLLLEPAPGPLGDDLERTVELLRERGFYSVVAHPERHAAADFEQRLRRLAQSGSLIQWTAQFVADAAPGELVLELAREGLVDLLGSDAHSAAAGRPVRLSQAFDALASVCMHERLEWIRETAPGAIVRGEALS